MNCARSPHSPPRRTRTHPNSVFLGYFWAVPEAPGHASAIPETIVRLWVLVGRVPALAELQIVQLFPDALGCHGNAFNPSLFGSFLKSSDSCGELPSHPTASCSLSSGPPRALRTHPSVPETGGPSLALDSQGLPLGPSARGSLQKLQPRGSASVPPVPLGDTLGDFRNHSVISKPSRAPPSLGKRLADAIALGCFRKCSAISWHPLPASPAGGCSALSGNARPSPGSAPASLHAPGPNALGHFRRGRARLFGTAAAVAEAGIPRLRRRRPRRSHGSGCAPCDGGRGGGGGRDQVSPGRLAWQARLGVRANAGRLSRARGRGGSRNASA